MTGIIHLIQIMCRPMPPRYYGSMPRALHRPYLAAALAFGTLGSSLGFLMLAVLTGWHHTRAWNSHVVAHAQFQVIGCVALFTLGMALQLLAPTPLKGSRAALTLLAGGTLVASGAGFLPGLALTGACLQLLGLALHVRLFWRGQRWKGCNLGYYLTGQLWLAAALATARLELALWGFACLYILGTGFRLHPRMLGCRRPSEGLQRAVLLGWNAALLAHWPGLLAASAALASLPWLKARREQWLRILYLNLAIACVLPPALARHALATGFILPMIVGMALELLPAFARRPIPRRLRGVLVGALVGATGVRLTGQAAGWATLYLLGGLGQLLALSIFVITIGIYLIKRPPGRIRLIHAT